MAQLKIENVPVGQLKPYSGNAKKHPAEQIEQIAKSIQDFGFNDPIAVWHDEIVEGHGRLLAALHLGLQKVPVIRLDDLNDQQRRAYTLVHNQLTLNTDYDESLLAAELAELEDIDLSEYGFEIDDDSGLELWKPNERVRTNRAYNLDKAYDTDLTESFFQMPIIYDCGYIPEDMIGFNYAMTSTEKNAGIHFFIDDYQFERIWNYPEKYIDILMQYDCILSPDFSLYSDMPMPMKIWNVYRSRQIGAYYQACGMRVIPTISWAEPETYCFAFDGIPQGSTVAVSTVGCRMNKNATDAWRDGMDAMIKAIEPKHILVYGGRIDFDFGDATVHYYKNKVTEAMRNGR